MVDFLKHTKRQEVQRVLTSRINKFQLSNINPRDRNTSRSAYLGVVWVIPPDRHGETDVDHAFPVVGKDISAVGLSLVHNAPVVADPVIVGFPDQIGPSFIRCSLEHCTSLGYGFYQVGLRPNEVVSLRPDEIQRLEHRLAQFAT